MADDNSNNLDKDTVDEQRLKLNQEILALQEKQEEALARQVKLEAGLSEAQINNLKTAQDAAAAAYEKLQTDIATKKLTDGNIKARAEELDKLRKTRDELKDSLMLQKQITDETKNTLDTWTEASLGIRNYSSRLKSIEKDTGSVFRGIKKGMAGFAKGFLFNAGVSILKGQVETTVKLVKEFDQVAAQLGKATNAGKKWDNVLNSAWGTTRGLAVSFEDVGTAMMAITTSIPEFKRLRDQNKALTGTVIETTAMMTKLGASSQEAGSLYKSAFDQAISSGMGAEEAARQGEQTMREFAGMSVALEVPLSNLISQYEESKDKLALLGKTGQKEFLKMAAAADKLGISIGAMTAGAGELFDVEAIAGRVGEVNTVLGQFGGELADFNKFMVMDAEERSAELARLVGTAGIDITELYRQSEAGGAAGLAAKSQLKSFQQGVFGGELQIEEMVKKVGGIQGLDVSDIEVAAEKASTPEYIEEQIKLQQDLGEKAQAIRNQMVDPSVIQAGRNAASRAADFTQRIFQWLGPFGITVTSLLFAIAGAGVFGFPGRGGKGPKGGKGGPKPKGRKAKAQGPRSASSAAKASTKGLKPGTPPGVPPPPKPMTPRPPARVPRPAAGGVPGGTPPGVRLTPKPMTPQVAARVPRPGAGRVPGGTPPIPNSKGGGGKAGLFGLATTAALAGGALAPALSGNVGSLLTEAGNLEIASGSLVGGQEIAGMTNAGSKGGRTAKMLADLKARLPNVDLDSFFAKFGGWASGLPGKISAFVDKIPFLGGVRGIGSKVRTFGSGALDKISSIPGLGKAGKLLGRALGPIFAIMESAQFVGAAKSGDFATAGELGLSLLFQAAGAGLGGLLGALGGPLAPGTVPAGMSVGASLGMASGLIANGIMKKLTPPVDLSGFGKILADLTGLSPELESADDLYIPSKGSPIKLNEKDEVFATKPGGAMEQAMAQNIGKMKAAFTATMNARKLSSEVVTSSAAEEEDRMARAFTKALMENKDNMPPINIHVKVPLDKRVVGEVTMETLNRKLNPANYFIE